jgi:hypothetical protein
MDDEEVRIPVASRGDRFFGGVHGRAEMADLVGPRDLETVESPRVVRMASDIQESVQVLEERF